MTLEGACTDKPLHSAQKKERSNSCERSVNLNRGIQFVHLLPQGAQVTNSFLEGGGIIFEEKSLLC